MTHLSRIAPSPAGNVSAHDDPACFFIVGAPRCGTSAMAKYLKHHPSICFSSPKETNFFVTVGKKASPAVERAQFLRAFFFEPDAGPATLFGEGSVSTLYSAEALTRILACFPHARFIVMLRNPVELLRSYHARLIYMRQETELDFECAWNLQDERAAGRHVPRSCFEPRLLQYREVGRLGHYTAQLFALAGRERCLPILFEDFTADTPGVYRQTLEFLGLPDDGRTEFSRRNQQRQFKSMFWQDLYGGTLLGPIGRLLAKRPRHLATLSRMTRPLRKSLKRSNAVDVTLPPLDPALRDRLRDHFAEDVVRLSELLGRDLSHWLQIQPPPARESEAVEAGERLSTTGRVRGPA